MEHNEKEGLNCPINYTLSILGGKWKWAILWLISSNGVIRYGRLKENLPSIAQKH
jgi:DNA-binding HxlR family transcriptional regulator